MKSNYELVTLELNGIGIAELKNCKNERQNPLDCLTCRYSATFNGAVTAAYEDNDGNGQDFPVGPKGLNKVRCAYIDGE